MNAVNDQATTFAALSKRITALERAASGGVAAADIAAIQADIAAIQADIAAIEAALVPTWTNLTSLGDAVQAGRAAFGYNEQGPAAVVDGRDVVRLRGYVYATNTKVAGSTWLTVPVEFRPPTNAAIALRYSPSPSSDLLGLFIYGTISTAGNLVLGSNLLAGYWLSFDTVSYSIGT